MARSSFSHSPQSTAIQLAIVALPLAAVYLLVRNEAPRYAPRRRSAVDPTDWAGIAIADGDGRSEALAVLDALEALSAHLQQVGATAGMIAFDLRRMSLPRLPRVPPDELQMAL